MKKLVYLLLLLPVLAFTQARYGVEGVPMCWTTPLSVDSSIVRYVLVSTTGQPVKTLVYENAAGVVVNVSGGTLRYGFCDCAGGGDSLPNGSVTWSRLATPGKDSIRIGGTQKRDTSISATVDYTLATAVGVSKLERLYRKVTITLAGVGNKRILYLPDGDQNMADVEIIVAATEDTIQVQASANDAIQASFRKVAPTKTGLYNCLITGAQFVWRGGLFDGSAGQGQEAIQFKDEGSNLGSSGTVTAVDVTGAGATASRSGNTVTINVSSSGVASLVINSNTTVSAGVDVFLVNTTLGARTLTIPPGSFTNKIFYIKKITNNSNNVTITPATGTIDGSPSYTLF